MKRLAILCLIVCAVSLNVFSQENTTDAVNSNYNELKLNVLFLAAGAFEVTYERTLTKKSGVGLSIFLPFNDDAKDYVNYYVSPYYRYYLGKKYASGFFFEGFGMLNSRNLDVYTGKTTYTSFFGWEFSSRETKPIKTTDFALGIGLGGKWLIKSKFIVELSIGVGVNLFADYDNTSDSAAIGKGGITVGYRF